MILFQSAGNTLTEITPAIITGNSSCSHLDRRIAVIRIETDIASLPDTTVLFIPAHIHNKFCYISANKASVIDNIDFFQAEHYQVSGRRGKIPKSPMAYQYTIPRDRYETGN
jgi:hypothetical protein